MNFGGQINGGMDTANQTGSTGTPLVKSLTYTGPAMTQEQLPVCVRTVLNLQRDTLAYWQGMSCLFNKWWYPEKDRVTLPFCFFQIVKYSETSTMEVSQKRVILYSPPDADAAAESRNPVSPGLMQTISDNVVKKPKEYKMEIIVPFLPFGNYIRYGMHVADLLNKTVESFGAQDMQNAEAIAGYIKTQLSGLLGADGYLPRAVAAYNNTQGFIEQEIGNMVNGDAMVNKTSLDAMFESGVILKFKTWMGFDYRYVVITNMTAEKRGTEDDVWRVSLTLQEMPVLSLTPVTGAAGKVNRSWILNSVNRLGTFVLGENNQAAGVPALSAEGA